MDNAYMKKKYSCHNVHEFVKLVAKKHAPRYKVYDLFMHIIQLI